MALVLNIEDYRNPPKMVWAVEEWYMDGQLVGYQVTRYNWRTAKQEVLESFFVDSYDNNQSKYAAAWNSAATLMSRANRDVLGHDEY